MVNQNYTHLALIVDRSGSMESIAVDMEGGIRSLLKEQAELPGELHVDITTFDNTIETPWIDVRADEVKGQIISPRGSTALNDAIGITVANLGEKLAELAEEERPGHVIVVVVTDGEENSSREYTAQQVKDLIVVQTVEYGWDFLYLAANVDAFATGAGYGFATGSSRGYDASSAGTAGMTQSASASILRTRSGLSGDFTEEERTAAHGN
jgi:hypothetical protein